MDGPPRFFLQDFFNDDLVFRFGHLFLMERAETGEYQGVLIHLFGMGIAQNGFQCLFLASDLFQDLPPAALDLREFGAGTALGGVLDLAYRQGGFALGSLVG